MAHRATDPEEAYRWFSEEMRAVAEDAARLERELTHAADLERMEELRRLLAEA